MKKMSDIIKTGLVLPEETVELLRMYRGLEKQISSSGHMRDSVEASVTAYLRLKYHELIVPALYEEVFGPLYAKFATDRPMYNARQILGMYFPQLSGDEGLDQSLSEILFLDGKMEINPEFRNHVTEGLVSIYKDRDLPMTMSQYTKESFTEGNKK